jgi:hypothetical protein
MYICLYHDYECGLKNPHCDVSVFYHYDLLYLESITNTYSLQTVYKIASVTAQNINIITRMPPLRILRYLLFLHTYGQQHVTLYICCSILAFKPLK